MDDDFSENVKLLLFIKNRIRALNQEKNTPIIDQKKLEEINDLLTRFREAFQYYEKKVEKSLLSDLI